MTKVIGLTETVLFVHDLERALAFYGDTLGLAVMEKPDKRGAIFLQAGEGGAIPQQIVLVPLPPDAPAFPEDRTRRPLHHIGFEIAAKDFETERQRLEGLGFVVGLGEHPFLPLRGLYISDPDGNEVELIAPKA